MRRRNIIGISIFVFTGNQISFMTELEKNYLLDVQMLIALYCCEVVYAHGIQNFVRTKSCKLQASVARHHYSDKVGFSEFRVSLHAKCKAFLKNDFDQKLD